METTTVRISRSTGICIAPQFVAEELLRAEGFTGVHYVDRGGGVPNAQRIARGEIDFSMVFAPPLLLSIDVGQWLTIVAGVHPGCFELFAHEPIRTISDLKGKRVGLTNSNSGEHLYLSIMATHIGLDARDDIDWVFSPEGDAMERFIAGETHAFLGFPPEPQELRARGVDRVILTPSRTDPGRTTSAA